MDARGLARRVVGDVVERSGRDAAHSEGGQSPVDDTPTDNGGFDELTVDDDERTVGVPVVVQADGLPGRPAEQPDLIGRCRQQPDTGPLRGVVSDVRSPQVLGGGQSTHDVGKHRHGQPRLQARAGHGVSGRLSDAMRRTIP